jgi:GNAT superfamily N-acetyltransferase
MAAIYRNAGDEEAGETVQVWVSPEFRGTGVARNPINALFRWCGENGIRKILTSVTRGNKRALKFYEKMGFELPAASSCGEPESLVLVKTLGGPGL